MQQSKATHRILEIDVLRGFALLGILVMNVVSFSMPTAAYYNPFAYEPSEPSTLNQVIFAISHILAEQKFMAIFSMLFGASIILFTQKRHKKKRTTIFLFYRRNFWLLIFGMLHFYLLWYGDILSFYAVAGCIIFFFRNLSPKLQLVLGFCIYCLPVILNYFMYNSLAGTTTVDTSTLERHWQPDEQELEKEIAIYRGGYLEQINFRSTMLTSKAEPGNPHEEIVSSYFLIDFFLRSFGMMLFGMGLLRKGVFSYGYQKSFYVKMLKYGCGSGIFLSVLGLVLLYYYNWEWKYGLFLGRSFNGIGAPLTACGYIGLVMVWLRSKAKANFFKSLQNQLAALGRMTLTGYLFQSVLASFIFYGYGLGLFGKINRLEQLAIVILIWAILLFFSAKWSRRFQYGPIEWVWQSLTYLKVMPIYQGRGKARTKI